MDGNGRWAAKKGLDRVLGHNIGVESVQEIVEETLNLNIPYLTLYAFSTENWNRPKLERLNEITGKFFGKRIA